MEVDNPVIRLIDVVSMCGELESNAGCEANGEVIIAVDRFGRPAPRRPFCSWSRRGSASDSPPRPSGLPYDTLVA